MPVHFHGLLLIFPYSWRISIRYRYIPWRFTPEIVLLTKMECLSSLIMEHLSRPTHVSSSYSASSNIFQQSTKRCLRSIVGLSEETLDDRRKDKYMQNV